MALPKKIQVDVYIVDSQFPDEGSTVDIYDAADRERIGQCRLLSRSLQFEIHREHVTYENEVHAHDPQTLESSEHTYDGVQRYIALVTSRATPKPRGEICGTLVHTLTGVSGDSSRRPKPGEDPDRSAERAAIAAIV